MISRSIYFLTLFLFTNFTAMDFDDGMKPIRSYQDLCQIYEKIRLAPLATIVAYQVNKESRFCVGRSVEIDGDYKIQAPQNNLQVEVNYLLIMTTKIRFSRPSPFWYDFISLNSERPIKIGTLQQQGIQNHIKSPGWFIIDEDAKELSNRNVGVLTAKDGLRMRALQFEDVKFLLDSITGKKVGFPMPWQNEMALNALRKMYQNQTGIEYNARPQKIA